MQVRLFVYGSLRPGQCNYDQLSDSVLASQAASVGGWLRLRPEGYPALSLAPDWPRRGGQPGHWPELPGGVELELASGEVGGDVLDLNWTPELGQKLDDFEGFTEHSPDYLRVACWTSCGWAWTYVAPEDRADWERIAGWPPQGHLSPWVPHQRR